MAPDPTTVNRRLERAARDGLVHKDGLGTKRSPFRYWLPRRGHLEEPDFPGEAD
jgi:hypothetical protein